MRQRKNFTLVEIMIVVAIIGLLAAIAIPSFMKARESAQENACVENLRQLDSAAQQPALNGEDVNNVTVLDDYVSGNINSLHCPANASGNLSTDYANYNTVNTKPSCSVNNNHIPSSW